MSLFEAFKKKTDSAPTANSSPSAAASQSSAQKINLSKNMVNLNKAIMQTKENTGVDLSTVRARVVVVMDISGSMEKLYKDGSVQSMLTQFLPFAIQFDDNEELDVFVFADYCKKVSVPMTEDNFENYVKTYILDKYRYGGTEYACAICLTDYAYNDIDSKTLPTLVFFITDGENSDKSMTNKAIIESAEHGIFYQFIGIGRSSFKYLESLDNLEGRVCDNTGFMTVEDFKKADSVKVFVEALKDYVPWLKFKGYIN